MCSDLGTFSDLDAELRLNVGAKSDVSVLAQQEIVAVPGVNTPSKGGGAILPDEGLFPLMKAVSCHLLYCSFNLTDACGIAWNPFEMHRRRVLLS